MPKAQTRYAITAIIYDKRGNPLSVGQNSYVKTHPLQKKYASLMGESYKEYLHAEICAITRVLDLSRAYKISIFRWSLTGEPMPAKPCRICQAAIKAAGIRVIQHT